MSLFISLWCYSQDALHNFGNIQMHGDVQVGFHLDLINDGSFDQNMGLAGFYHSDRHLTVSGSFRPIFQDAEIMVDHDLFLEVGLGITHNANLISGDINTPRNATDINLQFLNDAFYIGDSDITKVDGYSAKTNKSQFKFPVGDVHRICPLELTSSNVNPYAKCAYFYEDPNAPSTFPEIFDTRSLVPVLSDISTTEYWHLDSSMESTVKLGWDSESRIGDLVRDLQNLRVVAWHKNDKIWENLGNATVEGDLQNGYIISEAFDPNLYSIITFGAGIPPHMLSFDNLLVSANGDGVNDSLIFEGLEVSPNNVLKIYNRWGRLVYQKDNYSNSFVGIANVNMVVDEGEHLPEGVYFYIIELFDVDLVHQGFLYVSH
ncbi:MAG: gliding motility-associated C-terminal domain-containing protein [Flavobacteriaceae bacterium]